MERTIKNVKGREILDSRGYPTIEVVVILSDNSCGCASVPSGASTGKYEAVELRDGEENYYFGKGVTKAVEIVNQIIAPEIINMKVTDQKAIDDKLIKIDGTKNKSNLGANSMLGVSLAVAKAAADSFEMPLYRYLGGENANTMPVPLINVINGGLHADNSLDFQEFMILPIGGSNFKNSIRMSAEVFHNLRMILKKCGHNTSVGDEGGFAPNINSNEQALNILISSIENAGYKISQDFVLGLDVAASTFYKNGTYKFADNTFNADELINYYEKMVSQYPIASIEDPIAEDDYEGWKIITKKLGGKVQLVGDDLFVTNCDLIKQGVKENMANAVLIKPNQIGTLTETLEAIKVSQQNGYRTIVSHRSGETEDTTIAHIAVAMNCGQIKAGSLSRSERLAKYNELLRIEESLNSSSLYYGRIWG